MKVDDGSKMLNRIYNSKGNENAGIKRGKLKIFFGMSAGVGKTYAMLQAAVSDSARGMDVVVGCADTHGCQHIHAMLKKLDHIPPKSITTVEGAGEEIDLDTITQRRPHLVVIDELAHSNPIGSRHAKRYQDVLELLDNGISVYTTLNLEELDSRSDSLGRLPKASSGYSVPDEIFETADEVELVDVSSRSLLNRLTTGMVQIEQGSREAEADYFSVENIILRRELALRLVSNYVNRRKKFPDIEYVLEEGRACLMVLVGSSAFDERLIRLGKRLSYTLGMSYVALHVEQTYNLSQAEVQQLTKNIGLAKELGAKMMISAGADLVGSTLRIARQEKVSHIIVGRSQPVGFFARLCRRCDTAGRLMKSCRDIDIFTVNIPRQPHIRKKARRPATCKLCELGRDGFIAFMSILITILGCLAISDILRYETASYIIVLVVMILSMFLRFWAIVPMVFIAATAWYYIFIPPTYTFQVVHPSDLMMTIAFIFVAIITAYLSSRFRRQEQLTRIQAERTTALYHLTERLATSETTEEIVEVAKDEINKYFEFTAYFLMRNESGELSGELPEGFSPHDTEIAKWSLQYTNKAGKFSNTMTDSQYTFCPLKGMTTTQGVVVILSDTKLSGEKELFWNTFVTQISNTLEQHDFIMRNRRVKMSNESDMLYQTIFNSVSHELRIPVTSIMASAHTMLNQEYPLETQKEFLVQIFSASNRLNRLIENLLNTSRIESRKLSLDIDWYDINDLFNKVVDSLAEELEPFNVEVMVPQNMPLVKLDFGIMEQVIQNLVYNSCKYTEPGTTIRLTTSSDGETIVIQEMDQGPGFPADMLTKVFDKFYRGDHKSTGGLGLGLSIAKEFVKAHGGTIDAKNRPDGGALFTITLPV